MYPSINRARDKEGAEARTAVAEQDLGPRRDMLAAAEEDGETEGQAAGDPTPWTTSAGSRPSPAPAAVRSTRPKFSLDTRAKRAWGEGEIRRLARVRTTMHVWVPLASPPR